MKINHIETRVCPAPPSRAMGIQFAKALGSYGLYLAEINEDEVKKHPFEQEIPQRVFYRDGTVGDWQP